MIEDDRGDRRWIVGVWDGDGPRREKGEWQQLKAGDGEGWMERWRRASCRRKRT